MPARITLEFDDQTSQGFQSLVRNLEKAEGAERGMAVAGAANNAVMEDMIRQQMAVGDAIQRHTVAALASARRGFMETVNTTFDFVRNMRDAAGAAIEFGDSVKDGIIDHVQRRGAASVILSLGSAFGKVGPQVIAVRAALGTFNTLMDHTGKRVVAVSDDVSVATKNMANQINSGHKTIQEVQEETGASLEELGLKAETNYTRYSQAVGDMVRSAASDLGELSKILAERTLLYPGAIDDAKEQWDEFDRRLTTFADNAEENSELIQEAFDKIMGRNTELRRQQEKMDEDAERKAPMTKRIQAFEKTTERQMQLQREISDINRLETQKEVQARMTAERQKRAELKDSFQYRGHLADASEKRLKALMQREEAIRNEYFARMKQENKQIEEDRKRAQKEHLEDVRKEMQEEFKLRKEALKKQKELEDAHRQGKDAVALQTRVNAAENLQQRLQREGGHEDEILALDKTIARERAQFQEKHAKDEVERAKIKYDLMQELRELDQKRHQEAENRKAEASNKAAAEQEKAQRERIQKLRSQRDESGHNLFEQRVADQSKGEVLQEITRQRLAREKNFHPNLGSEQKRQLERSVRGQTARDAMRGGIGGREVSQAQRTLAVRTAAKDKGQGKINDAVYQIVLDQAKQQSQHQHQLEQQGNQLRALQSAQRNMHTRRRGQLP